MAYSLNSLRIISFPQVIYRARVKMCDRDDSMSTDQLLCFPILKQECPADIDRSAKLTSAVSVQYNGLFEKSLSTLSSGTKGNEQESNQGI